VTPSSTTGYSIHIDQGSPKFLGEDHKAIAKQFEGPIILRNVIFSGHVPFYQINRFFVNILFFHYWQNALRPGEMVDKTCPYFFGMLPGFLENLLEWKFVL